MSWIDKPIAPTKRQQAVARTRGWRMRNAVRVEQRRRELAEAARERMRFGGRISWSTLETVVLADWHTDEHGCRARTVGNEA